MKRFYILLVATFLGFMLKAQVADLIFSLDNTTYTEITGGTALGNETTDDQKFVDPSVPLGGTAFTGVGLPIGFNFVMNGQTFDRFAVNANGWISLGKSSLTPAVDLNSTSAYTPLSSTYVHTPNYLRTRIAPFARDLQAQTGAEIRYQTLGAAPNRVLVVQWKNYKKYGSSGTGDSYNFQIRLYETTNVVEIVYGTITNNSTNSTVQVGLGGSTPTDFNNRTTTTDWLNTTAGNANTGTCSITSTIIPPSGTVFRWSPATCLPPSDLAVSLITSSSANITWNSSSTEFQLEYGVQGFTIGTGTRINNINSNNYTIYGLNSNTNYQVYVRAICAPGDTSQWAVVGFTTLCDLVTQFSENFDAISTPNLPSCWYKSTTGSVSTQTSNNYSAPNCLYLYSSSTTNIATVSMPPVSNAGASTHRLRFMMRASSTAGGVVQVGYLTNPSDFNSFVSVQSFTASSLTYQEYSAYLGTLPGNNSVLAFRHTGNPAYAVLIDNVKWEEFLQCMPVAALTASNITSNSADISWNSTASEFELEYGLQGFTLGTGTRITSINSTSYSLTSLNPITNYQVYVRAICAPGDTSQWISTSFTTECEAISMLPWTEDFENVTVPNFPPCWYKENGDWVVTNNANSTYDADALSGTQFLRNSYSATNEFIWTPGFELTAGESYDFSFWWAGDNYSGWTGDVFVNTSQISTGAVQLGTSFVTSSQTTSKVYKKEIYTFVPTVSGTYYFAIRINASVSPWYISFDDFKMEPTPECPDPLALTVSNITQNSVQLSWNQAGNVSTWNIEYGPVGFTQGTGTIISVSSNPYTLTGLNYSTTYTAYVQADCGGGLTSNWSFPITFTTSQVPATMPYFIDFEAGTEQWTFVNGSLINKWHHGSATAYSGTKSVYISNDNGVSNTYTISSTSTVHFYRDVTIPNTSYPVVLEFAWKNMGENSPSYDYVKVYMINTAQSPVAGTQLTSTLIGGPYNNQNNWQIASIQIPDSVKGTTRRFVFSWYNDGSIGTQPPAAIDDIRFYVLTCPKPTNLSASNITQNSADLSWTAGGSETEWQIQWGTGGFVLGTGTIVDVTSTSYTLTGLNSSLNYTFYVRAICGPGDTSSWAGPFHFATQCGPLTVVYTQNFDGVTPPALPNCWTSIVQGSSGSPIIQTVSTTYSTSPNSVQLFNSTASGSSTHILLISPQFSDLPTHTTQISFKAKYTGSGTGVLYVGTMSDPANPATFSVYQTIMTLTSQWQEFTVAFNNYTGSNQYIAFKHGLGMTNQYIYIDDIVYELIPSCPKPSNLLVHNVTGNMADVSWTAGGSEISWDIIYGPAGFNPNNAGTLIENITTTTYTITGLNPTTNYQVYVLAQCDANDSSSWTGPFNFTTTQIPATLPYVWDFENDFQEWTVVNGTQTNKWYAGTAVFASPTKSAYISNTNGSSNNYDGTVSSVTHLYRDIQFPSGSEFVLTFKWKCQGESTFDYMRVFLENTTFVPVEGVLPSSAYIGRQYYNQNNTWKTDTIFFNSSVSNTIKRLIFTWRNDASVTYQPPIAIDDIEIRVITCPRPTNLTVYNVTSNSAQISWTEEGSASSWQIQYGLQGFLLGTGTLLTVNSNPYTITGLSSGMNYSYYVRSICGSGDTSFWAGPFTFYIPCDATIANYTENFDAVTTPNLPLCWTKKVIASSTSAYVQTTTTSPSSSPNCAVLYNSNSQGTNTHLLLISPRFSDLTSQNTRIRFKLKGSTTEKLIVGTMTDYTDENTFVPYQTLNIPSSSVWTNMVVSFQGYTGTGEYIAFKHATQSTYTYVYIDDFIYEQLPSVELAATKIINPNSGCGLSSSEPITVRIKNLGISPVSNIPVNYVVNTSPVVSEQISLTLNPGDSIDYTFATTADLSQYQSYTIKVYVSHSSDPDQNNDTTSMSLYNAPVINNYPYYEDFEQNNGYWVSGGINSSWQWGTPSGSVINSAASGTKAWVTNLSGYYNNNENSYVISPCFDISSLSTAIVELKRIVQSESSYDGAVLLVSPDDVNWIPVGNVGSGTNWYNDNSINGLAFTGTQIGWTGTTNTAWVTSSHPIQNVGGYQYVKFAVAFGSDASVNSYEGFAFDDFRIYLPLDVALVYPINNQTENVCGLTNNEPVSVWIKNVGGAQIDAGTSMQLAYSINNGTPVTENFLLPQPLSVGDSIQYIFNQTADFSNITSYLVTFWVKVIGDVASSNDTIVHTYVNYNIYVNINGGDTVCVDPVFLPYTLTLQPYPYGYDSYFWSNQTGTQTGTLPFFDAQQFGWYYVTVTDGNCIATDSIFVCNILSATSSPISSINVYPSPAPVKLLVRASSLPVDDYKVSLTTIEGKVIFSKYLTNTETINIEIPTAHLSEGIYMLSITGNKNTWNFKVIR